MKAALPNTWTIRAYKCPDPLPGHECVAHVFQQTHDRHGRAVLALLCATAFGPTCDAAAERLTAFLERQRAEDAKRQATIRLAANASAAKRARAA